MHQSYILTVLGSNPSRPTEAHNHEQWYNFVMENVFDQEVVSTEVAKEIIEEITSQETVDVLTEDDYTKVDESEIDWAVL